MRGVRVARRLASPVRPCVSLRFRLAEPGQFLQRVEYGCRLVVTDPHRVVGVCSLAVREEAGQEPVNGLCGPLRSKGVNVH